MKDGFGDGVAVHLSAVSPVGLHSTSTSTRRHRLPSRRRRRRLSKA